MRIYQARSRCKKQSLQAKPSRHQHIGASFDSFKQKRQKIAWVLSKRAVDGSDPSIADRNIQVDRQSSNESWLLMRVRECSRYTVPDSYNRPCGTVFLLTESWLRDQLLQRAYFGQNRPPLAVKETFLFHSVRPLCAFFVVPPLAFPFLHAVHLENSVKEVKIVIALLI